MKKAEQTVSNEAVVSLPELPAADAKGYVSRADLAAWYDRVKQTLQGGFQRVDSRVAENETATTNAGLAALKPGIYQWMGYEEGRGWKYWMKDGTATGAMVYFNWPIHLLLIPGYDRKQTTPFSISS